MNGAVYISFFQGQLESVLEQVVQLAVQEISKTVGSSLNALLLETAVKEQENRRLKLQLQSRETRARGTASCSDGGGSPVAAKNQAGKAAGDERADGGRTKPEQQPQQRLHAPGGHSTEPSFPTDTRRLEQRGRIVGRQQLHNTQTNSGTSSLRAAAHSTRTRGCVTLRSGGGLEPRR